MPTTLTADAVEKSTYAITASFTDEDGAAEDIKTLTWTLSDSSGNIVNSREDESVTTPGSSESIVLSGDDLEFMGSDDAGDRVLTISATYDSALGTDLPLKDSAAFTVINLASIK